MKFLVINTKGGATKSTTANQILAPYLYQKNGSKKIQLIEFDDENSDSLSFENNEVFASKQIKVSSSNLESELLENILEYDDLVIDVGGNKTTTFILEAFANNQIMPMIDIVLIPLTDGEQDSINAINTYNSIKELSPDIKVLFVLGRVDTNMSLELQFLDFYGDNLNQFNGEVGKIESIAPDDRNIIQIENSDTIKYSRIFGITVYELAMKEQAEIQKNIKKAIDNGNKDEIRSLSYRGQIVIKSKKFFDEVLEPAFQVIDKVVGV